MNNKGQKSLEILMNYGWALVIIVVVAGVLFMIATGEAETTTSHCIDQPEKLCCENGIQILESQSSDITTLDMEKGFENTKFCWINTNTKMFVCAICK